MSRTISLALFATLLLLSAACSPQSAQTPPTIENAVEATTSTADADLAAVKQYTLEQAQKMKAGSVALAASAQTYYDLLESHNFDYQAAWAADPTTLTQLVTDIKAHWLTASTHYELDEGIIAGVPSLAYYDVWIDAGPSAEEAPAEALEWTLTLPDGRELPSPGNFFHSLLEPAIWGTRDDFGGLAVDLNGDGATQLGEALPDANLLLAAAQGLDSATSEMIAAVEGWQPTLSDAFTALAVMIPTMNEYFEQWKLSAFVAGESSEEAAFIGTSRLFDINGILSGLDFTYDSLAARVQTVDPALHDQINNGFADLRGYVGDLYGQEQAGTRFSAEQADLFGTEAQTKATALSGQVSQAAALLDIEIAE